MIFLTVGTQFPFDRLVQAVDESVGVGLISDEVFAQIGSGGYRPRHVPWTETLDRRAYSAQVACADALVGHAGIGTVLMALDAGKPLLVMPRRHRFGEVVNDHQVRTAERFAALGHVLVAWDETQIPEKLAELRTFVPHPRAPHQAAVVACVREFLQRVEREHDR